MKDEKMIDLVLAYYDVASTPEVRKMVQEFIDCDLKWFEDNFEDEEELEEEYDDLEEYAYHAPYDESICGRGDHFSYYDNCFR